jgi:hypothetical protein
VAKWFYVCSKWVYFSGFLVPKMVLCQFVSGKNGFMAVPNWFIYVSLLVAKMVLCQFKIGLFMSV